ncbi:hypothetical protein [Porphyrobacter sp. AAP60]|uniref:hypothetical protein n=1 Tax=Porphyrobacter sp. AAP60 TaxID=1523423 RepID=UPI0006B90E99|nr:hypothetical protein [Porphyrobacter sp. AAP60]KPF63061.1 hypothetical protein IP79_10890 [Porphyrobacter sp. AAP60]
MKLLRTLSSAHHRVLLAFVLAALGMQALIPAGLMVAPSAGHGAQIILCPQTHPLARAAASRSDADADAGMAAIHAAMGHGPVDHTAMGHAPAAPDEPVPAPSAAPASSACAFAGAGALAALLPERGDAPAALLEPPALPPAMLQPLQLAASPRLRPPLRGPPALT